MKTYICQYTGDELDYDICPQCSNEQLTLQYGCDVCSYGHKKYTNAELRQLIIKLKNDVYKETT